MNILKAVLDYSEIQTKELNKLEGMKSKGLITEK